MAVQTVLSLLLMVSCVSAQDRPWIRIVDDGGRPVVDALVQVLGLRGTAILGAPDPSGRTDPDGRVPLDLLQDCHRIRLGWEPDLDLRLLVLEADGRLSVIPMKTLTPGETIGLDAVRPPVLELAGPDGAPLPDAVVAWLTIEGIAMPQAFRDSGRLVRTADAKGRISPPRDPGPAWFRLSQPTTGESLEFLPREDSGPLRRIRASAGESAWTLRLDAAASRPWSPRIHHHGRPGRDGRPRSPDASWMIELRPGESRRFRERPDLVSIDCLADGRVIEPGADSGEREVVLHEGRWPICRGRFLGLGAFEPPTEVATRLDFRDAGIPVAIRAQASVGEDLAFAVPHPGDESVVSWRRMDRAFWPWLGAVPNDDTGRLLVEIDLRPRTTTFDPRLMGPQDHSEHLRHEVSGRVLRSDGGPAAFRPVIVTVEDQEITFWRMVASRDGDAPRRAYDEPEPRASKEGLLLFTDADGRFELVHEGRIYALRFGYAPDSPKCSPPPAREESATTDLLRIRRLVSPPLEFRLPE